MSITTSDLHTAITRAHAAMATLEGELNLADSRLGDGDTGGMLARVIASLAAVDVTSLADPAGVFTAWARAASAATGSSLGTLFMTALLSAARSSAGRAELPVQELGPLLLAARDAMLKRGQSNLGDKTVIDALDSVGAAISGCVTREEAVAAARDAADDVLARFRDQPSKVGRARMFGDQSRGSDDPGMLAFARQVYAITTG